MKIFESTLFQWVGRRSYSLYLWHWPAIVLFKWTVGIQGPWQVLSCAIIFTVVAWASYRWIEDPSRKSIPKLFDSNQIVRRGSALIVASSAFAACLFVWQSHLSLSVTSDARSWYSSLTAEQRDWKKTEVNKPVVYAFGDSHAGMMGVALQELERRTGVQTRVVSQPGCPVANLRTIPSPECQQFIDNSLKQLIKQHKEGDVVLLISLRVQRFSDQWGLVNFPKKSETAREQERVTAFRTADEIIKPLEKAGFKVVISAPLPVFKIPPFRCSDWFNKANPVCAPGFLVERQELVQRRTNSMDLLGELKVANPKLKVWDAFDVVCPPGTSCNSSPGVSYYFDGDHLTALGNRLIYPSLERVLREIGVAAGHSSH
jgi:SGNH domain (fused to AT3 domains)